MNKMQSTPDYLKLCFVKNCHRPNTYDITGVNENLPFRYFIATTPKHERFIKQGAKLIIESWEHHIKILFTGLVPVREFNGYYTGDHLNQKGVKSMLIVFINSNNTEITIYYFRSFNKYPKFKKIFVLQFIHGLQIKNRGNHAPVICSQPPDKTGEIEKQI